MAWQLIYTSAPRLLEAGRSGFGTVARHREMSSLLVSAVERVSQFSRQPGQDVTRVVFSHRIIPISGSRFHVLSCIRDAGADYTGRTNHIAHHVIVDQREIAQLGGDAPTPAEILLAMPWLASWDGPPRSLGSGEEVDLGQFRRQTGPQNAAWQHATGSASNAWLLANGPANRGAYLVAPASVDLRWLFAESMRLVQDRAWQNSCTTSLQPSDESSDFRWIGLEDNSALRNSVENAGRPVLDLTRPQGLPEPEIPYVAAPSPTAAVVKDSEGEMVATAQVPAEVQILTTEELPSTRTESVVTAHQTRNPKVSAPSVKPLRPSKKDPPVWEYGSVPVEGRRRRRFPVRAVVIGTMALVIAAVLGFGFLWPLASAKYRAWNLRSGMANDLVGSRYFSRESSEEVARFLLPSLNEETYRGEDLKAILRLAGGLLDAKLKDFKTAEWEKDQQRLADIVKETPMPPRLRDLKRQLEDAEQLLKWAPNLESVKDANQEYGRQVDSINGAFAALQPYVSIHDALIQDGLDKIWAVVLGKLTESIQPANPIGAFKEAITDLKKWPGTAAPKNIAPTEDLVELWSRVDAPDAVGNRDEIRKRLETEAGKAVVPLPNWLLTRAQNAIRTSGETYRISTVTGNNSPRPKGEVASGEAVSTQTPIYIAIGLEDLKAIRIAELSPDLRFELWSPPETKLSDLTASTEWPNLKLRTKGVVNGDPLVEVHGTEKRLVFPTSAQLGASNFAVVARRDSDAEAVRILVIIDQSKPLFAKHECAVRRDGRFLRLQGAELQLLGMLRAQLKLQFPPGFVGGDGGLKKVPLAEGKSVDLEPIKAELVGAIERAKLDINKIQEVSGGQGKGEEFQTQKKRFLMVAKVPEAEQRSISETAALFRQVGECIRAAFRNGEASSEGLFHSGQSLRIGRESAPRIGGYRVGQRKD